MPPRSTKRKRETDNAPQANRERQRSLSSDDRSSALEEDSSDAASEGPRKASAKSNTSTDIRTSALSGKSAKDSSKQHVRFGSEEPPAAVDVGTLEEERRQQQQEVEKEAEDGSDDEAPEDVSASAALQNARDAAAAATKAADGQRKAARQRRREQEEKLKAQAEETRKAAAAKRAKAEKKSRGEAQREKAASNAAIGEAADSDSETEPDLLPDELLMEDIEREPTPPPVDLERRKRERKQNKRKKLLDQSPKDVKVGPVNVSVLQKANRFLPPKAAPGARDRREHWLAGRSSGKGTRAFERRPMNAGFV